MTDPLELLDQYYDGTLSEEGAEELRGYIKDNPEISKKVILAAFMHNNLHEILHGLNTLNEVNSSITPPLSPLFPETETHQLPRPLWRIRFVRYAAVAAGVFLISLFTMPFWHREQPTIQSPLSAPPDSVRSNALLASTINADWDIASFHVGDALPMGTLRLRSGLAQIQFPSGTSMVVAGPVEFTIDSPSQVHLYRGALTSVVSPNGIGFSVISPTCTLTDLGTEFGMYVDRNQLTHAEVFKGQVRVTTLGPDHESQILRAEHAVQIASLNSPLQDAVLEPLAFVTLSQFSQIQRAGTDKTLARWSTYSQALRHDQKTLAYYTFEKLPLFTSTLPNVSASSIGSINGLVDGATWDQGRFTKKSSLRFTGGKSSVHINLPQPLSAFTIAAWINPENFAAASQQPHGNRFTALLLSDGVREGAVHWQIMDGQRIELGLSIGKYTQPNSTNPPATFQHYWSNYDALSTADLNHWLFIVVVVNPETREVRHYCNGNLTGIAPIDLPPTALIGPAEIGNWDPQTLRPDAVRGFIGRIDELAVIARPMSDQEIEAMYNAGGGQ